VAHYIFNLVGGDVSQATGLLRARMWGVGAEEPHRDALAPGDFALVYLAAPERKFIGRAELVSVMPVSCGELRARISESTDAAPERLREDPYAQSTDRK
jgi:hypothetical protein